MFYIHPAFSYFIVDHLDVQYTMHRPFQAQGITEADDDLPSQNVFKASIFPGLYFRNQRTPESLIPRNSTSGLGLQHSKAVQEVKCTFSGCSHLKLKHFLFILFEKQALKLSNLFPCEGGFSSLQPSGTETTTFNICNSPLSPNCDDTVHLGIKHCRNTLSLKQKGGK